jgi:HEPN pEK499 p136
MEYQNLVIDFATRTKANLEIIERLASQDASLIIRNSSGELDEEEVEAYEVTQLVNSLLGLVIFPQQRYFEKIPQTPLLQLEDEGWPKPLLNGQLPTDLNNLQDLMRYVRNSIAHFNIEFTSNNDRRINGIKIWNNRRGSKNWSASLKLEELKVLVAKFTDMMLKVR